VEYSDKQGLWVSPPVSFLVLYSLGVFILGVKMYDMQTIQNHAKILAFLAQNIPQHFSKVTILPKTKAFISQICGTPEWKEFKSQTGITAKDLDGFMRHWKTDLEYSVAVISGNL
jgi:hypothetical protein